MAKNKIITSQGNVQFINSKGRTINMHPMHCYAVYENDTVSFLFIYMKDYSGQAFFASQYEDLEVNGETFDNMDDLKDAINYAFAKAGAQARTEIVDELPEDPFTNTIYLIKKEHGEGYDEYIWNEDEGWQLIGDTDIEFERYLKIDDFNPYSAATKDYIDAVSANTVQNASDIQFLSGAVDTEISDREAADTALSGAIDTVASNLADETTARTAADTALQNNINTVNGRVDAEQIARANADTALSGAIDSISGAVDTEVSARTAADEALDNKIDTVSGDVIAETSRAESAEIALGGRIDNEITARTAADTALQTSINNEASARTAADEALSGAVDTVSSGLTEEAQRAQDAETAIDSKVDTLSGEVQTMGDEAVVDAAYVSSATTIEFYNADGDVVASIDATDFVKDGMIEDVRIENGYLVIDFNTASGIEDIEIPLTDIFNPDNYYDKTAVDGFISDLEAADSVISGAVDTLSTNLATEAQRAQNAEGALSGAIDTKLATSDFNTYSGAVETRLTEDERVWGEALNDLNSRINTVSGDVASKASQSAVDALNGVVTAHTANTTVHVTAAEKATWNNKSDFSGSYNDLTNKLSAGTNITIVDNVINATGGGSTYTAGDGIDITNDVISVTGKVSTSDFNTYSGAVETRLTEDEEVTSAGLNALNESLSGKQNTLIAGENITISGNVISATGGGSITVDSALDSGSTNPVENRVIYNKIDEVEQVTAAGLNAVNDKFDGLKLKKLTQTQYDNLSTKDPSTLYIIVN